MSPLGADFPRERFLRTPVSVIQWVLREIDDHEKLQANINASTTAQLAQLVVQAVHAFSQASGPGPDIKAQQFLPFPDWKPQGSKSKGLDTATKNILAKLLKQGQIPIHVFAALSAQPEEDA